MAARHIYEILVLVGSVALFGLAGVDAVRDVHHRSAIRLRKTQLHQGSGLAQDGARNGARSQLRPNLEYAHHGRAIRTQNFRTCTLNVVGENGTTAVPFHVPSNDQYIGSAICAYGHWEELLIHALLRHVRPGSVVVDAGANIGTYTVQFAQIAGKVVSFEPQPMLYQLMVANAINSGAGNIDAYNMALGFKFGRASMAATIPDGDSAGEDFNQAVQGRHTINYGGRSLGKGGELVPMVMLDKFKLEDVSLIKIDVQGAENLMVWGSKETIIQNKPVINIEDCSNFNHSLTSPENIELFQIPPEVAEFKAISWLKSIGYKVQEKIGDDVIMVHPEANTAPRR